jgi:hypothetical protein
MSKFTSIAALAAALTAAAFGSAVLSQAGATPTAFVSAPSVTRQISSLSSRIRGDESKIAGLQRRLAADEAVISGQAGTIQALQARHLIVDFVTTTGGPNGAGSDEAQSLCPSGDALVGGGAGWTDSGVFSGTSLNGSQPVNVGASPGGWLASGARQSGDPGAFTVTAFCARVG